MKKRIDWPGFLFVFYLVVMALVGVVTLGKLGPF